MLIVFHCLYKMLFINPDWYSIICDSAVIVKVTLRILKGLEIRISHAYYSSSSVNAFNFLILFSSFVALFLY